MYEQILESIRAHGFDFGQRDTEGKRACLSSGASDVFDPTEWGKMLSLFEERLDALLLKEQEN